MEKLMGILDWLQGKSNFRKFDDAFAINRSALGNALLETLQSPQHQSKSRWLVVHFTQTFTKIQELLDSAQVKYSIVSSPIDPANLEKQDLLSPDETKLVLSELIPAAAATMIEFNSKQTIAIMVAERHPQISKDDQLEEFARSLPVCVELGHFISLEDEIIKNSINEKTIQILKQLGVDEADLIASNMLSNRLKKSLRKQSLTYTTDNPADSAYQWLKLNGNQWK